MVEKVPVKIDNNIDLLEMEIRKHLTQFADDNVYEEYKESTKVIFTSMNDGFYTLKKRSKIITATENSCTCGLLTLMGLPCRHIMAVRKEKNLPIYVNSLSRLKKNS